MTTMVPFLVYGLLVLGMAVFVVAASALLGWPRRGRIKDQPYESGIPPTGDARARQALAPYYLVAIFFILFDVEIIFLYPWAVRMYELSWDGFVKAFVFLVFVFAGLVYIWLRGGLIWRHHSHKASDGTSSSRG